MKRAEVNFKNENAGWLIEQNDGTYIFKYNDIWISNSSKPAISLNLPKREKEYSSPHLFPFFYNLLPEGKNKEIICQYYEINPNNNFELLLHVTGCDTIGAVTLKKVKDGE